MENFPRFFNRQKDERGLQNEIPIKMFYQWRLHYFSFRKIIESETTTNIPEDEATQMVTDFIIRNNFVMVTDTDKLGRSLFRELRANKDLGDDSPGEDVLLMQGIKFQRIVLDIPVVNASAGVDFHPDTKEILGIKLYNWTPLQRTSDPIPPERVKSQTEILDSLRLKVKNYCNPEDRAKIIKISPAWFQTKTYLIPILAFEIEVQKAGQSDENIHNYLEFINISGSDDIFKPPIKSLEPES